MSMQMGEETFSALDDEKKAQILRNLNEEIERQKAKYLLNASSRLKESGDSRREEPKLNYNPQKVQSQTQRSYDNHIEMLESAKDNLKQIQSDIQSMTNQNDYKSKDDRDDKVRGYDNYNERHFNDRDNEFEEEGANDAEEEQGHYRNEHQMEYDGNQYPEKDQEHNYRQPAVKERNEEENLEEEELKDIHEIMSSSNYNNGNNGDYLNSSNSPNIKSTSSNRNTNQIGGYNFFNPIDYNPNQHKGIASTCTALLKKSRSNEKEPIADYREKSFDQTSNYKAHQERDTQVDHQRSPYFKRIAKLYTPKYKSKEKYEIMKKEIETKFTKDHPFKPEVNYTAQPKSQNESNQQRYDRLSQPKTIEIEQRMKKKEQNAQEQININCRPLTNQNQSAACRNVNPASISDKLYKLHDQLKEKKEKMKREYEDNKIKEYSFAPEINKESRLLMQKYDTRPIYERNEDFERAKNENLLKMRQEIEREQLSYYKPLINERSKELANRKTSQSVNEAEDIHEKLYRENIRNDKHNKGGVNPQYEECTFTPKLNYETFENEGGNIDDFLERQKVYEQLKKERLERKIVKSNQKNDYTFTPKINLTSDILMKTNSLRANEAIEDKIDRLYKQDYEEIQRRKEQLQSFYDAQYDFKPKINELSRFIGRDPSINDLNQRAFTTEKLNKSQGLTNHSECTFKPSINKEKYNYIQSNYKADEDISNRINDEMMNKKQKITGLQSAIEKKNVVECKFKPDINKEVPNFETKEPMLMKGMAKHLEQMEKARKAKREKEEREKEVFITGDNWSRDNLFTVPKPFKLSYQYQQKKGESSTKKAKEKEMKECTFKPMTNESKNREIIKQLLKD